MQIDTWFAVQGHETVNFGGQGVKGQGHTRPKLYLEAWRRHRSRVSTVLGRVSFLARRVTLRRYK